MQFVCSFLSLSFETSSGGGCARSFLCSMPWRGLLASLFSQRRQTRDDKGYFLLLTSFWKGCILNLPRTRLQIVISWGEFVFGLVKFLVCRKLLFLKFKLFQIMTQKANICMWSIELNWYHTHKGKNWVLCHEYDKAATRSWCWNWFVIELISK